VRVTIEIKCDNEAFTDNEEAEVARILHRAAERLFVGGLLGFVLLDMNGNTCGSVTVTD
jgi:hypothetical protein